MKTILKVLPLALAIAGATACSSSTPAASPSSASAVALPSGSISTTPSMSPSMDPSMDPSMAMPIPSASVSMSSAPGKASTSPGTANSTAALIVIKNFGYAVPAGVAPGATVTVKNSDDLTHTVTADSGNAFADNAPGDGTTTFTAPTKPGSYPFHCDYHGNMHGILVVK